MSEMNQTTPRRAMSVPHLVMGLIFLGIAGVWLISEAGEDHVHRLGAGIAVVLIGAGVIGLLASLANARSAKARRDTARAYAVQAAAEPVPAAEPTPDAEHVRADRLTADATAEVRADDTRIIEAEADSEGGQR
ncbi:MAG TPA: hypothetical protein VHZ06_01170 [Marmoricola sp.]|jgi:hypothetical protein|nr:hypothetical protein [Marmoricola sp.]